MNTIPICLPLRKDETLQKKQLGFLIYTVSTKGQSRQCHPLQSFANEHSLLEFIAKNLEPDTA